MYMYLNECIIECNDCIIMKSLTMKYTAIYRLLL